MHILPPSHADYVQNTLPTVILGQTMICFRIVQLNHLRSVIHRSIPFLSAKPTEPYINSSSALTSHAGPSGCGRSRSRSRSSRTRRICSRPGRGGACASGSERTPNRRTTSRTTRSASRRHDARASASGCGRNPTRSSSTRNVCISYSSANLPLSFVSPSASFPTSVYILTEAALQNNPFLVAARASGANFSY